MVSSATAMAFLPGQLVTNTPWRLAAATSMVLTPAPARTTRPSRGAAAKALRTDLGRSHDQDVGTGLRQRLGQVGGAELGSIDDLDAERRDGPNAGGGELVRDEHAHGAMTSTACPRA
ncbi:MAG: hypothetical protein U0168_05610 [Nannocystaceae bacterium]